MKISLTDKKEIREKVEAKLKRVAKGKRIKLDKQLLEFLLFDEETMDKEKGLKAKVPVWSGEFLQKIDLSEVDFTNVLWSTRDNSDFYDTNAKIDLTKSFEAITRKAIILNFCDFGGLDFSSLDLSGIEQVILNDSDIGNTNLVIPKNVILKANCSRFDDIDLSGRTIDALGYIMGHSNDLSGCFLCNTNININLNPQNFEGKETFKKNLANNINMEWIGTNINGKKVHSKEEKKKMAEQKKAEYEAMKKNLLDSINASIELSLDKRPTNHR